MKGHIEKPENVRDDEKFAKRDLIGEKALEKGIYLASAQKATAIGARLMEAQQKIRKPSGISEL